MVFVPLVMAERIAAFVPVVVLSSVSLMMLLELLRLYPEAPAVENSR